MPLPLRKAQTPALRPAEGSTALAPASRHPHYPVVRILGHKSRLQRAIMSAVVRSDVGAGVRIEAAIAARARRGPVGELISGATALRSVRLRNLIEWPSKEGRWSKKLTRVLELDLGLRHRAHSRARLGVPYSPAIEMAPQLYSLVARVGPVQPAEAKRRGGVHGREEKPQRGGA